MSASSELMRILVVALIVGNLLTLVIGALLLVAPRFMIKLLGLRNKHPVSVRRVTKPLEKYRDIDGPMMRYAQPLGALLIAGGAYVLVKWGLFTTKLAFVDGAQMIMRLFPTSRLPQPLWETIWLALVISVIAGAVLAIAVGLLAFVRANSLKRLSKITNKWVSTRRATKPVAQPYYGIARLIAGRPQLWGGIIALLSGYTLAMMLWFIR